MKEIKAIIRPFKLLDVAEALKEIEGMPGVTVSEIRGFGKGRAVGAKDKVVYEMVEFVPRIQLEVVVNNEMVNDVINTIQKYAHTGIRVMGKSLWLMSKK
jgi:nitrogen regulatory protein P-II 1